MELVLTNATVITMNGSRAHSMRGSAAYDEAHLSPRSGLRLPGRLKPQLVVALACMPILGLGFPAGAKPREPEQVFALASASCVSVIAKRGSDTIQGSAVMIAPNAFVTAYHVVRNAREIELVRGEKRVRAMVTSLDRSADLAVLRTLRGATDLPLRPATLAKTQLKVGARVFALGSPKGLEASFSEGIVSGFRAATGTPLIQTTAAISHGSSGGALFDIGGRLVGITVATIEGGQALNLAIPVHGVKSLLADPCNDPEVAIRWPRSSSSMSGAPVPLPAGLETSDQQRCLRLFRNLGAPPSRFVARNEEFKNERCVYVYLPDKSPYSPLKVDSRISAFQCSPRPVASTPFGDMFECCPDPQAPAAAIHLLCIASRPLSEIAEADRVFLSSVEFDVGLNCEERRLQGPPIFELPEITRPGQWVNACGSPGKVAAPHLSVINAPPPSCVWPLPPK